MLDIFNLKNKFFKKKLVILDDVFPYLLSGFRIAEYNYYLDKCKTEIYSTFEDFEKIKNEYSKIYPLFAKNIHKFDHSKKYNCSLFYTIFLNNIFNFLPIIEKEKTPFIFTLYPGGGFCIDDKISDDKLRKVCSSKYLKKIIATQINTKKYLINKGFCKEEMIEFIYGGVLPSDYYKENIVSKKYYRSDKNNFDICFVANKYMERGVDKGYDVFIDVAKKISALFPNIFFHVVGGFTKDDIDITEIENKIKFYGIKYKDFFPKFYSEMDMIISPNRPYVLFPGSFDGFPTGSCVEAGLAGVAVFCSDELNLNICFKNNEDIYLIPINAQKITEILIEYYKNPDKLYDLAKNCQNSFLKNFNIENQMEKRYEILKKYL